MGPTKFKYVYLVVRMELALALCEWEGWWGGVVSGWDLAEAVHTGAASGCVRAAKARKCKPFTRTFGAAPLTVTTQLSVASSSPSRAPSDIASSMKTGDNLFVQYDPI